MKIKCFLQYIVVSLGITGWSIGTATAQQPIPYDILDLNDTYFAADNCDFLFSPNYQHSWMVCISTSVIAVDKQAYFLFPIATDGHLGKRAFIKMASHEWGLNSEDRLIAITDSNQFVWLNLKTAEIVFLSAELVEKSDKSQTSGAKRQSLSNLRSVFKKGNEFLSVTQAAVLDQDSYLVSVKQLFLNAEDVFWIIRLQNKNLQWIADDLISDALNSLRESDFASEEVEKEQHFVLNNQSKAMVVNGRFQYEVCFNTLGEKIESYLNQGGLQLPYYLGTLPNGNFIVTSQKAEPDETGEWLYKAHRTIFTQDCKQIETGPWELSADSPVMAMNISKQGEIFLVYADYQDQVPPISEDDEVSSLPNALYLAKFTKENKLLWVKELVERNDPWHEYLDLRFPISVDEPVKYNIQIHFSGDDKEVLVLVDNKFQSEEAQEILGNDPKNLLPRIYRVPVN